jgi:hypothetical protein
MKRKQRRVTTVGIEKVGDGGEVRGGDLSPANSVAESSEFSELLSMSFPEAFCGGDRRWGGGVKGEEQGRVCSKGMEGRSRWL